MEINRLLKKSICFVVIVARHCGVHKRVRLIPRSSTPPGHPRQVAWVGSFLSSLNEFRGFQQPFNKLVDNERGVALVLALVMLFLMSLLGSLIFTTSTTEVQISRNYRSSQSAFYAAERGVQYAYGDSNIYSSIIPGTTNSVNVPVGGVSLQVGSSNVAGTVQYVGNGNPPRGSGVDVTQYQANYYVIDVTGTGGNNSNLEVEAGNAKIVPKQ